MAVLPTPNIRTFQVFPDVPEPLQPLLELAHNLWWVWNYDAVELFRRLDRELWHSVYHNPVKLLGAISQQKLIEAAHDDGYLAHLSRVHAAFKKHMSEQGWYQQTHGEKPKLLVGYFSAEFGIDESLPIYAGGLGVLAGDHLKSASELGVPLVGVGLLYRGGYFRQGLDRRGRQTETYPTNDPTRLAVELARDRAGRDVAVELDLADAAGAPVPIRLQIWRARVGRVDLYLLDPDVEGNPAWARTICDRL